MTSKIKTAIIGVVAVFVILIVVSLLTSPTPADNNGNQANSNNTVPAGTAGNNSAPTTANQPPATPAFQTAEKNYQVIEPRQDGTYRARDLATNKEAELFIPEGSIFTAGDRGGLTENAFLTATRYLEGANGLVVTELSVSTKQ